MHDPNDPHIFRSVVAGESLPFLDIKTLLFHTEQVERIVRNQEEKLSDAERDQAFNYGEHAYLQNEFPNLAIAFQCALQAIESANVWETPSGLMVIRWNERTCIIPGVEGFMVVHPEKPIALRGFTELRPNVRPMVPIEWIDVILPVKWIDSQAAPPDGLLPRAEDYKQFVFASLCRCTFWQVWYHALRAEAESLTLPFPEKKNNDEYI